MYGVSDGGLAYFITKTVVEVPLVILQLLVQYLISYFMMDLQVHEFHFRLHTATDTTATTTSIYAWWLCVFRYQFHDFVIFFCKL
jgi:hypothetical protein